MATLGNLLQRRGGSAMTPRVVTPYPSFRWQHKSATSAALTLHRDERALRCCPRLMLTERSFLQPMPNTKHSLKLSVVIANPDGTNRNHSGDATSSTEGTRLVTKAQRTAQMKTGFARKRIDLLLSLDDGSGHHRALFSVCQDDQRDALGLGLL